MRLAFALALVLALLAPSALAHVDNFSQSRSVAKGPFLVFFEPRPVPPFANTTSTLVVQVSDNATGMLMRSPPPTSVLVGGPDFAERTAMEHDGTGYLIASMVFPQAGNYSARVLMEDEAGETHMVQTEFEVFPNLPFRIRPVDAALDVVVGTRTPIAFEVVDPVTLARKDDAFTTLDVRVEHWTEDHSQFLGAEQVAATKAGSGVWRIDHSFKDAGMHHLRFASEAAGFNYDEVPLLHIYVLSREAAGIDGDGGDAGTPGPGLALVLGLVALVAWSFRKR